MRSLIEWLTSVFLNAIALLLVDQIFAGFYVADFKMALFAAVVLSILNIVVRPLLIILTIPLTVLTFGLFLLVINTITLIATAALLGRDFMIDGFATAFLASIIISLISLILHKIIGQRRRG